MYTSMFKCVYVCVRLCWLSGTDVWLCVSLVRAGSGYVRVGAVRLLSEMLGAPCIYSWCQSTVIWACIHSEWRKVNRRDCVSKDKLRSTARLLVAAAAIKWVRLDIHTKSHKNKQAKETEGTKNQPLYLTLKNTAWNWPPLEVLFSTAFQWNFCCRCNTSAIHLRELHKQNVWD